MPEYIEMTPTWYGIMPVLLAVLRNPDADPNNVRNVIRDLETMAEAADKWNEYAREQEGR